MNPTSQNSSSATILYSSLCLSKRTEWSCLCCKNLLWLRNASCCSSNKAKKTTTTCAFKMISGKCWVTNLTAYPFLLKSSFSCILKFNNWLKKTSSYKLVSTWWTFKWLSLNMRVKTLTRRLKSIGFQWALRRYKPEQS